MAALSEVRSSFTASNHRFGHFVVLTPKKVKKSEASMIDPFVDFTCKPLDKTHSRWELTAVLKNSERDLFQFESTVDKVTYAGKRIMITYETNENQLKEFSVKSL